MRFKRLVNVAIFSRNSNKFNMLPRNPALEVLKYMEKHTLSVLVENAPGVLTRVAGLFARRGFNIDSLAVGRTDRQDVSRMTIVVEGDKQLIEQVTKQLHKLIDVIKISNITEEEYVDRELVMVKVAADPAQRVEIMHIAGIFRARAVDLGSKTMTFECTGTAGKINAFEESLRHYGIKELVRTGKIALLRGSKSVTVGGTWQREAEDD